MQTQAKGFKVGDVVEREQDVWGAWQKRFAGGPEQGVVVKVSVWPDTDGDPVPRKNKTSTEN